MLQEFKIFLKKNPSLKKAKLLLAISGGVDSMVLWRLLEDAGLNVSLAHVNFQLRAKESDDDQAFLKKEAKRKRTKLHLLKIDTKKVVSETNQSTQIAAREIRYNWFKQIMQENEYTHLLTAHHLNDSIETFFINLNRGTGIKGLSGIHSRDNILRPLLKVSKTEIIEFAKKHKVPFHQDSTNADSKYLRNWFRNDLLSLWKERNPQFEEIMYKNMIRFYELQQRIDQIVVGDLGGVMLGSTEFEISNDRIENMNFPKHSLALLLEPLGFNFIQIEQLLASIKSAEVGAQFLSKSHQITVDRYSIFITKFAPETESVAWINKEAKNIKSPMEINFRIVENSSVDFLLPNTEYFDAYKLKFPLKIRKWYEGDRIQPLGMNGSKLVSDILIDEKVPRHKKEKVMVLLSNEQLVAVIGWKISERFKIDKNTNTILQIQWL